MVLSLVVERRRAWGSYLDAQNAVTVEKGEARCLRAARADGSMVYHRKILSRQQKHFPYSVPRRKVVSEVIFDIS
jgi:hypothetical protein